GGRAAAPDPAGIRSAYVPRPVPDAGPRRERADAAAASGQTFYPGRTRPADRGRYAGDGTIPGHRLRFSGDRTLPHGPAAAAHRPPASPGGSNRPPAAAANGTVRRAGYRRRKF